MLHRERQAPSYFTQTSRERHKPGTYYAATVDAIDVNNNRFPSLALPDPMQLSPPDQLETEFHLSHTATSEVVSSSYL